MGSPSAAKHTVTDLELKHQVVITDLELCHVYLQPYDLPCRAVATFLVTCGCIHEHIHYDSPRCEHHAMSGRVRCRKCFRHPYLGHRCEMVTITRKPYPFPSV